MECTEDGRLDGEGKLLWNLEEGQKRTRRCCCRRCARKVQWLREGGSIEGASCDVESMAWRLTVALSVWGQPQVEVRSLCFSKERSGRRSYTKTSGMA